MRAWCGPTDDDPSTHGAEGRWPVDGHGRLLSTTLEAAEFYRLAQQHSWDRARLMEALRRAALADPAFALAEADYSVLVGRPEPPAGPADHMWERHHLDVVRAAAQTDICRAVDLLREHLAVVRCDPVALAVALQVAGAELLGDILAGQLACHRRRASPRS